MHVHFIYFFKILLMKEMEKRKILTCICIREGPGKQNNFAPADAAFFCFCTPNPSNNRLHLSVLIRSQNKSG